MNNLYFDEYARTLKLNDNIIIGNILLDGRWIKLSKKIYDYIFFNINKYHNIEQILSNSSSEKEQKFYIDLIQKLQQILVLVSCEHCQSENDLIIHNITLEITKSCNLSCRHCSSQFGPLNKSMMMSFETLKSIIDLSVKKKVKTIVLTGGEIYTHPNINEYIRYIHNNFSGHLEIMTNGTLIKSELDFSIIVHNVDKVNISLDGFDEESVSKIRGKNVFTKVLNVISILKNYKYKNITLSYVLTKNNEENIKKFYNLCNELDVMPIIRILNYKGRARDNYDEFKNNSSNSISSHKGLTMKCICPLYNEAILVSYDGYVYPCAALRESFHIGPKFIDLFASSKLDIKYIPIVDEIDHCKKCPVRYFCSYSCVSMNEAIFKDDKLLQAHCDSMKDTLYNLVWE